MKLNCDLGESFGSWSKGADDHIMPLINLANIACGFHASDPLIMQQTIKLAAAHNVTIGAHPGYPDLVGFGRRTMAMSANELISCIQYQIGALQALSQAQQVTVEYVKPHGALYNDMMKDLAIFKQVCQAISTLNQDLVLMLQALPDMTPYQEIAQQYQLTLWFEAFADRNYQDSGLLVSRSQPNAVIHDAEQVCQRIQHYQKTGELLSENGQALPLAIDTFCVHGDNPSALKLVEQIRTMLNQA